MLKRILKAALRKRGKQVVAIEDLRRLRALEQVSGNILLNRIQVARFLYLDRLVRMTRQVEGEIVECGVGKGISLLCLCHSVSLHEDSRCIWGFDSFEGFPEPSAEDASRRKPKKGQYAVDVPTVTRTLMQHDVPDQFLRSRVTLVKGFVEQTLPDCPVDRISLLNLDVDLYESYKTCLEQLWDRMSPGAIVTFDEYIRESHAFPGARKAIDKFFAGRDVTFEKDRFYGKYFVRKP